MAQDGTSMTTIVMGKTGSGKSQLCNVILNTTDFPVGRGGLSKTQQCQSKTARTRHGQLTVVDTPGTRDVKDKDKARDDLREALQCCRNGVDAFIVVIRCDVRLTDEECKAVEDAVDTFGPECFKRVIVAFTHGDVFNNDESEFRNDLELTRKEIPRFNSLLSKFGNRFLLMDNGPSCDAGVRERQLTALMNFVHTVAALNPDRFSRKDMKAKKKDKKKLSELKDDLSKLKEEFHGLQLQRLEDKLHVQERESLMREKLMQLGMHMQGQMQHEFQLRVQEMRVEQMQQMMGNMTQLMITAGENHSGGSDNSPSFTGILGSILEGAGRLVVSPFVGAAKAIADR